MKSNTLTFITSLTVILELWIPCKTKQESFDVVTNLQLHAVERWECQMTQFKWQFWTWKMSKQKYSELNYTLNSIKMIYSKSLFNEKNYQHFCNAKNTAKCTFCINKIAQTCQLSNMHIVRSERTFNQNLIWNSAQ